MLKNRLALDIALSMPIDEDKKCKIDLSYFEISNNLTYVKKKIIKNKRISN